MPVDTMPQKRKTPLFPKPLNGSYLTIRFLAAWPHLLRLLKTLIYAADMKYILLPWMHHTEKYIPIRHVV